MSEKSNWEVHVGLHAERAYLGGVGSGAQSLSPDHTLCFSRLIAPDDI